MTIKSNTLYYTASLPAHWVARDGKRLVMFPAAADGWRRRSPYRGHVSALLVAPAYHAFGTGWQNSGAQPLPPSPSVE